MERIIEASLCWSWLYAVFPFSERFRECGSFNYFSARYLAKPSLNSFYVRYILPNLPFLIEYYLSWFIMKRKTLYNKETVAWTRPSLVHSYTSWEVSVSWKMLTIKDTISDGSTAVNAFTVYTALTGYLHYYNV